MVVVTNLRLINIQETTRRGMRDVTEGDKMLNDRGFRLKSSGRPGLVVDTSNKATKTFEEINKMASEILRRLRSMFIFSIKV